MNGAIRIGTSGWHYPTGAGTWNGPFYPKPRPKGFDELEWYSRYFDTVEINSTFYGQPRAAVAAAWAERTPPGFLFAAKLYQQFTHPRMFRARVERELIRQLGTTELPEEAIATLVRANQADLDEFRRGIEPLATAGKLGPLLAQFPASFHDSPGSRVHLAALLRAFHGHELAVELRHKSWSDRAEETRTLLDAFGATWVWIDEPKFKDSVEQPVVSDGAFLYLRLHGRNAKAWWHHADRDERYDYLYTEDELRPTAERLKTAVKGMLRGYAYLNNHPRAQAVRNALQLRALVGQPMEMPAKTMLTEKESGEPVRSPAKR
ncbi:MAG: DUF72 domain-containing protein [Vicinamibacterales bacterium]